MKDFFKNKHLLTIIIILGVFFRFYNLGTPVMHTDEAEVYFASQNILESGVPKGFYKVPFYENAYLYESNNSMYEFESTNYYKTDLVLKKGWLPYYITAFVSLFGKSEFLLRFPFALMGVVSLFFFYKLTKLLFNNRTALIAAFFYAISPSLLFYERMMRYYSPMTLLIILSLYFFVKAFNKKNLKDYFLGTVSLILLFHTNILIFTSLLLVIVIYGFIKRININKKLIYSIIILILLTLPWILLTNFIGNLGDEPKNNVSKWSASFIFQTITAGINNQGLLYVVLYLSIIVLIANVFLRKKISNSVIQWKNKSSNNLLLTYLIVMIIIPYSFVPQSSFEEKLFLSLIPISLILIAKLLDSLLNISKHKAFQYLIIIIIILISFVSFETVIGHKGHNNLSPKQILFIERNDLFDKITKTIKEQAIRTPLILTTSEQFPLMFYTDHPSQIIWSVRKEFINRFEKELVIIQTGFVEGSCNFFYQYVNPDSKCANNKNYLERINKCEVFSVDKTTNLYFCQRKKFIGGNLGLFSSDFPKEQPPDFIWDLESFPIAVNLENRGETDVNRLKIVFTNDFSGKEFDTEKKEFLFTDKISAMKLDSERIVTSKKYFSLGNVTFNHKLITRSKLVNANIRLCYPYTTKIKVYTCDTSPRICFYEVSGAPIQISNVHYNNLNFNFSIQNSVDGELGNFDYCAENNSTEKISIQSDAFNCESSKNDFSCQSDNSKIKKASFYIISLNYNYQQELKKKLLLRSKERNKFEYENFYKKK